MKINENIQINKNKQGELWSNISGTWKNYSDSPLRDELEYVYSLFKRRNIDQAYRLDKLIAITEKIMTSENSNFIEDETTLRLKAEQNRYIMQDALTKLINFFSEFSFEPNFRFCNTFSRICYRQSINEAKNYIRNYFALTDNSYANAIEDKMQSLEFSEILDVFAQVPTMKQINNRFKLYYGSQGTGKTTQAMQEANNNVMVCHSAMLPSDLMEDFKFNDGKAAFTPSALYKAMTNGDIIVLDEINLLPFESLRFLQSLLDGKSQFEYKGQTIQIADGFKIIGTMNLQVNGMTYALPEPLVDRAEELKQFKLTADNLINAIL